MSATPEQKVIQNLHARVNKLQSDLLSARTDKKKAMRSQEQWRQLAKYLHGLLISHGIQVEQPSPADTSTRRDVDGAD
jgi:hypothetical protein